MTERQDRFRRPSADEQTVLREMQVKLLVRPKDLEQCDQILVEHHYLHSAQLVGEQLRYAVVWEGRWLAVAAWSAAALHLKARDAFIGWTEAQRRERLPLVVNNARLYVVPDGHYPNLVSRFMKLMLGRLSADWQSVWRHPVALAESFVDPNLYRGTAYKVSGWSQLGHTRGWKRSAVDFYEPHGVPKQVWIRELEKHACVQLRAAALPPPLGQRPAAPPPPLHRQGEGDRELDGALGPGRARVSAPPSPGLSAGWDAGAHRHGHVQRRHPRLRRLGRLRRHPLPGAVAGLAIPT
jgi:hypothetical protein